MDSTTGWGTELPHALTTTPPQKSKYLLENTDNIYVQMKNLGHQDGNLKKKKKANRKVRNDKHGMRDKDILQWAYQQTGYDKRNHQ